MYVLHCWFILCHFMASIVVLLHFWFRVLVAVFLYIYIYSLYKLYASDGCVVRRRSLILPYLIYYVSRIVSRKGEEEPYVPKTALKLTDEIGNVHSLNQYGIRDKTACFYGSCLLSSCSDPESSTTLSSIQHQFSSNALLYSCCWAYSELAPLFH